MFSIGIVGLPNVGKSTLFSALTKRQVDISNYPFCTIEPNIGIISVPDDRLEKLAQFSKSEKSIPAAIKFYDIAGLVKGAAQGEGLGNQFLANIRKVDAILQVVRAFDDKTITHVHNKIDPQNDIEIINWELILKDLETVEKRLEKITKEAKSGKKEFILQKELLENLKNNLEKSVSAKTFLDNLQTNIKEKYEKLIQELCLLTIKPIIYVINQRFEKIQNSNELIDQLNKKIGIPKNQIIILDIKLEKELIDMPQNEQEDYKKELNIEKLAIEVIIKKSYEILNLITFFSTGKSETRAWTIKRGTKAPQAGAVIHTDFENKFIKAEVINWKTLINASSWINAKEKGLLRNEGKEYIVKDGDVIVFKI